MRNIVKTIRINLPVLILLFLLLCGFLRAQQNPTDFPIFSGPYVGQKPPGYIPQVFMPGIVSSNRMPKHSALSFSPDGTEVYWSVANPFAIYFMKLENGQWTKPQVAPFTMGNISSLQAYIPDA